MNETDYKQPEDASKVYSANARAAGFGSLVHEDQSSTEEHRENGHHLGFKEQMIEVPDHLVEPVEAAAAHRVGVRPHRPGKTDDIHRENSEQRKASKDV